MQAVAYISLEYEKEVGLEKLILESSAYGWFLQL